MSPFDVYIAYISWGSDGKRRPVLVLSSQDGYVSVFRITTQYQSKSVAIRSKYLEINDWRQAGLDKPSYIDMNVIIDLPITTVGSSPIGKLSEQDKQILVETLEA